MDPKSQDFTHGGNSSNELNKLPIIGRKMLYKIFMEIPAILCVVTGPEFNLLLSNEPFYRLIGKKDLNGKTMNDILPELEGQGFLKLLTKVYESGVPFTGKEFPVKLIRESGIKETVYLNFNCQAFLDHEEKLTGILIFAYDVTEQVVSRIKVENAESSYKKLVEGLPSALFTCNADGFIDLYNDAAVSLWGTTPEPGKVEFWNVLKMLNLKGEPLPFKESPMYIALKEGRVGNGEIMIERPDGTRRNVIPYPQPLLDVKGKINGAVNVLVDITEQVKARKQLEQALAMLANLYVNAPAFICTLKGPEFQFDSINPEYQKLHGKRKLEGRKLIEAVPELKGQGVFELLNNVYNTGEPFVVTEKLLFLGRDEGKEPEPTYLNFSYQPMYDKEHEIDGILVFGYEVTEQVLQRKKGEENLKTILESLPQITSTSSADGTNIYFNKFFFNYSGLSREEASSTGWNSILHPDEIRDVLAEWENCKTTGSDFYKEIRLKRESDGMYRWHIAHLTAVKNSSREIVQWVATATDIHEQKTKEQKKDEFLSIASHELKTPLTTVKAYLQLLELSLEGHSDELKLYTKKAIQSVDRLKDLISELLDVNKIKLGLLNINISSFNFNEMLDNAIDGVKTNLMNHKIIKTGLIKETVEGDKERLEQVIINLLSNAIKYSPDEEFVFLDVSLDDGFVKVSVTDTGIGIAKTNLDKIFDRYFRVADHDIQFQGLGIGLYISMNIIQQHKGTLWAESKINKGSTFYITIPLKRPDSN
ncbi:MAG: PAS domain-containing sensor histidine kinase [Ginsengibacter sp.]